MPTPQNIETSPSGSPHLRLVGGAGTALHFGQIEDLDENPKTNGTGWRGEPGVLGEAQKMLTDSHVRRARDSVVRPVTGAEWDVEPADATPLGREIADFVAWNLFELNSWRQVAGRSTGGYITFGFHLEEVTDGPRKYDRKRFPNLRGRGGFANVITGFHHIPAWSVEGWEQSKRNPRECARIRQHIQGSDVERARIQPIDAKRVIRWTWEQEGADFEGNPIQRAAYGPWFVKRLLARIEAMAHEKHHLGIPVATRAERGNDDDDIKLAKTLANWRAHASGHLLLPFGYAVDFKNAAGGTNIRETIDGANFDIAHTVAGGFMLLGKQGNDRGSRALAQTQQGQYALSLDAHGAFHEDTINCGVDGWSLIERLVRLNYGVDVALPFSESRRSAESVAMFSCPH